MSDETKTQVVSVEDFEALKAKTENFDKVLADATKKVADEFATKLDAEKQRADEFAAQLTAQRKTNTLIELRTKAEKFSHLPLKPDEFAEKFYVLSEKDAELAKWLVAKFEEFDTVIAQGALFNQFSRANADSTVETLDGIAKKIVKEEFGGDMKKYKDAFIAAGARRPDLANSELNEYTPDNPPRGQERAPRGGSVRY